LLTQKTSVFPHAAAALSLQADDESTIADDDDDDFFSVGRGYA